MKTQEKDIYHGAVLTQIVEHESFKALNRASPKYGHYLVNTDRHVFVKYRKNKRSPWIFKFSAEELQSLQAGIKGPLFLCLVCGTVTVCALNAKEIKGVLALDATAEQFIRVEIPKGGSCHITSGKWRLKNTIPHNSFPGKLFH